MTGRQIRAADFLVLNKTDLVDDDSLATYNCADDQVLIWQSGGFQCGAVVGATGGDITSVMTGRPVTWLIP